MIHIFIKRLANMMALLGGGVLCALIVMVCVSVSGRALGDFAHAGNSSDLGNWLLSLGVGPILGDFELLEAGMAFAIFAFLPLTQLCGAHAKVDIFTSGFGPRFNNGLATFWSVVMALVVILITWRLYDGLQDKMRYGETTFLIQFPIWWAYAACLVASVASSVVAVYCAVTRMTGRRA